MRVTSTLYRFFGIVGGPLQLVALLSAAAPSRLVRGRPAFRPTLAGTACLAISIVLWFLLVQSVNRHWAEALQSGPDVTVRAYGELRGRWELGHAVAFTAWLCGFVLMAYGVVRDATAERRPS